MKIARWTILLLSGILTAGCVNEKWTDCISSTTITVTLQPVVGHDPIGESDIDHFRLYIFGADSGNLLGTLYLTADQIGVPQVLEYPQAGTLRVVAVANSMDNSVLNELNHGDHISSGAIHLLASDENYQGKPRYELCDDLMYGEALVRNSMGSDIENVILPIKRVVAGIYIRVSGLENIPGHDLDMMQVALGSKHNAFGFGNGVHYNSTRSTHLNLYHVPTTGRHPQDPSVIEAPAYADGEDQFFRILSTDEGDEITISIFHGDDLYATVTRDESNNVLTAANGKLNVFELSFDDNGRAEVSVSQAQWGDTPELNIEF